MPNSIVAFLQPLLDLVICQRLREVQRGTVGTPIRHAYRAWTQLDPVAAEGQVFVVEGVDYRHSSPQTMAKASRAPHQAPRQTPSHSDAQTGGCDPQNGRWGSQDRADGLLGGPNGVFVLWVGLWLLI